MIATKRATGEAAVERLHREARMLTLAQHPGVVELLSFRDLTPGGDHGGSDHDDYETPRAELRLAHAGTHSLATLALRNVAHASALVAAAAETVADLHSIGIVHRRLEPSHILIDHDGRPILAGFAEAALVGDPVDPASGDAGTVRPADDLPALGRLLARLVGSGTEPDPIPERRSGRRPKSRAYAARALLNLADQATADDPSLRPSARSLATAIRAVEPTATFIPPAALPVGPSRISASRVAAPRAATQVDGGGRGGGAEAAERLPQRPTGPAPPKPARRGEEAALLSARVSTTVGPPSPEPEPPAAPRTELAPRPRPSARRPAKSAGPKRGWPAAAALVGVAAITFGVLTSWRGERPNLAEASPPETAAASSLRAPMATTYEPPTDRPATSEPPAPNATAPPPTTSMAGCTSTAPPTDPATAAGACARSVPLADGILRAAERRYQVGEPGDEVLVGDWRCDGTPVPVLIRPRTGTVFLFNAWASPGVDVEAVAVATVEPGAHLETGPGARPAGCLQVLARTTAGTIDAVPIPNEAGS